MVYGVYRRFTEVLSNTIGVKNNDKKNNVGTVVTRIAPSPTGLLHIGTARSALFNYLFAKKYGGSFILRIEDTDKKRSTKEFETDILKGLKWLGLESDNFYRQSERLEIYKDHITRLIADDFAYISKEVSKDDPNAQVEIIRLRNPNKEISFDDMIRGTITFNTEELGDFVIARSTDEPLYHLAVVVDDHLMGITHVIRGDDHISNTPRQILIQEALDIKRPQYAHIPLILAPDRSKMSKRSGATPICQYKEDGYLPEALLNYLALLGWNPGTDDELFTLSELVEQFDIKEVQKGGAVFSTDKLNWFNKEYIKHLSEEERHERIKDAIPESITQLKRYEEIIDRIIPVLEERISYFGEVEKLALEGELSFYFEQPDYTTTALLWKDKGSLNEVKAHLKVLIEKINTLEGNLITTEQVKESVWSYAQEKGKGDVLWPMRYALTGREKSPDPFVVSAIVGKEETILRLKYALKKIS